VLYRRSESVGLRVSARQQRQNTVQNDACSNPGDNMLPLLETTHKSSHIAVRWNKYRISVDLRERQCQSTKTNQEYFEENMKYYSVYLLLREKDVYYVQGVRKSLKPFFLGAQCVESGVSCTDCY